MLNGGNYSGLVGGMAELRVGNVTELMWLGIGFYFDYLFGH